MVREAKQRDLDAILELYLFLHEESIPKKDDQLRDTWMQIIQDPNERKCFTIPLRIVECRMQKAWIGYYEGNTKSK